MTATDPRDRYWAVLIGLTLLTFATATGYVAGRRRVLRGELEPAWLWYGEHSTDHDPMAEVREAAAASAREDQDR